MGAVYQAWDRELGVALALKVIKPPADVDPEMKRTPPPSGARMPVIPPPGTPGGDPSIKPK